MFLYDFHNFFLGGQAVLAGVSPYTVPDFLPPFPVAVIFAMVAWLPEWLVYLAYLVTCIWLLWKLLGKKCIWALLSFPVCFGIYVGQVDLLLTLLMVSIGPWALPLLIMKPQVGFVLAPWYIRRMTRKQIIGTVAITILFLGVCFVIRPTWLSEWINILPTITTYARHDSNLHWFIPQAFTLVAYVIGIIISLPLGFLLKDRELSFTILHLFSPLSNIYSASVLTEWIGPIEAALSWIAVIIVGNIHSGAPLFVIGLSILIRFYLRERKNGNNIFLSLKKSTKV